VSAVASLDVVAHGRDLAPDREGRHQARRVGEGGGQQQGGAGERVALCTGARAQERDRAAQAQTTQRQDGNGTVARGPVLTRQVAELRPGADDADGLEPRAIAALERRGGRVVGKERVQRRVICPRGD
jgi:hypothetical protein